MALGQSGQAKLNRVKHTTHLVLVLPKGTIAGEGVESNHKSVRVFKNFYERMRAARIRKARARRLRKSKKKSSSFLSFPSYLSFFLALLTSLLLSRLATRRRVEGKLGNVLHTHWGEAF